MLFSDFNTPPALALAPAPAPHIKLRKRRAKKWFFRWLSNMILETILFFIFLRTMYNEAKLDLDPVWDWIVKKSQKGTLISGTSPYLFLLKYPRKSWFIMGHHPHHTQLTNKFILSFIIYFVKQVMIYSYLNF